MRRLVSCSALLAVVLSLAAGCASEPSAGEAGLGLIGDVQIAEPSGDTVAVSDGRTVGRGETVRVLRGAATLEFSGDRRIELRPGAALKVDRIPTLLGGDALMIAGATPFAVKAAGSTLTLAGGAARVGRQLGVLVATYTGELAINTAGLRLAVPALRQATIPSLGVLPQKLEPLQVDATDSWDRRFLGDAIELSEQLQARSEGITGQLRSDETRSAGFLTSLVPGLDAASGFVPSLVSPQRAPGETLVGASIAMAGQAGSLADRWRAAFAFRDDGASWGLVAFDQRVSDVGELSSLLDGALSLALTVPIADALPTLPAITATGGTPVVTPIVPSPRSSAPPTTATPSTPAGPASSPDEPPPDPLLEVVDTVDNLVAGLLGALNKTP